MCASQLALLSYRVQIPGTQGLVDLAASATFSAGLDGNGSLSMWGTDTGNKGVFTQQHPVQLRTPVLVPHAALDQLCLGFSSAAGITKHGRLVTWGWSGNDLQVRHTLTCTHLHIAHAGHHGSICTASLSGVPCPSAHRLYKYYILMSFGHTAGVS